MNLAALEARYLRQYSKLANKVLNSLTKRPTENQTKGFAFYLEAARRIRLLMDDHTAPERPGFIMQSAEELAPVRMGFAPVVEAQA